jgi:hypothetical protein
MTPSDKAKNIVLTHLQIFFAAKRMPAQLLLHSPCFHHEHEIFSVEQAMTIVKYELHSRGVQSSKSHEKSSNFNQTMF